MGSFAGFTPETIDFLWGIRFQNNREWFQAHKQMYLQELYRPMQALAQEVLQPLARELDCVCKVSRIYKDARRKPERPYKESLWICLRRDAAWWGEEPSLFFELTPDASRCGFLLWGPKPAWMEGFRQTIAAHPAAFQALAAQVERDTGLAVTGDAYRRKKPCPDETLRPWWDLKNLWAYTERPIDESLFSPDLAGQVRTTLRALTPLFTFCQTIRPAD